MYSMQAYFKQIILSPCDQEQSGGAFVSLKYTTLVLHQALELDVRALGGLGTLARLAALAVLAIVTWLMMHVVPQGTCVLLVGVDV